MENRDTGGRLLRDEHGRFKPTWIAIADLIEEQHELLAQREALTEFVERTIGIFHQ